MLRVEKALKKVDGVQNAAVNLATEKATVELDPARVHLESLQKAVADSGYNLVVPTEDGSVMEHPVADAALRASGRG